MIEKSGQHKSQIEQKVSKVNIGESKRSKISKTQTTK